MPWATVGPLSKRALGKTCFIIWTLCVSGAGLRNRGFALDWLLLESEATLWVKKKQLFV